MSHDHDHDHDHPAAGTDAAVPEPRYVIAPASS